MVLLADVVIIAFGPARLASHASAALAESIGGLGDVAPQAFETAPELRVHRRLGRLRQCDRLRGRVAGSDHLAGLKIGFGKIHKQVEVCRLSQLDGAPGERNRLFGLVLLAQLDTSAAQRSENAA